MGRRSSYRIPSRIGVKFFFGSTLCRGTITNISKEGMHIKTDVCLPSGSEVDLLIRLKEGSLCVPVKFSRVGSSFTAAGAEVINPSREYLAFVDRVLSTCSVNHGS